MSLHLEITPTSIGILSGILKSTKHVLGGILLGFIGRWKQFIGRESLGVVASQRRDLYLTAVTGRDITGEDGGGGV